MQVCDFACPCRFARVCCVCVCVWVFDWVGVGGLAAARQSLFVLARLQRLWTLVCKWALRNYKLASFFIKAAERKNHYVPLGFWSHGVWRKKWQIAMVKHPFITSHLDENNSHSALFFTACVLWGWQGIHSHRFFTNKARETFFIWVCFAPLIWFFLCSFYVSSLI